MAFDISSATAVEDPPAFDPGSATEFDEKRTVPAPVQDINDQVDAQKAIEANARGPQILENAAGGLIDTAKGFVPHSLTDLLGFLTPAVGAAEDVKKTIGTVGDILNGKSIEDATKANRPEVFSLPNVEQTAPFSRERFGLGFQTIAQLLMAKGISGGLSGEPVRPTGKTLTEQLAPILKPEEVPPAARDVPPPAPIETTPLASSSEASSPEQARTQQELLSPDTGESQELGTEQQQPVSSVAQAEPNTGAKTGQVNEPEAAPATSPEPAPEPSPVLGESNGAVATDGQPPTEPAPGGGGVDETASPVTAEGEQSPTGVRNAIVDKQRVARGLPERMEPLRKTNPEAWDAAMAKVDENPNAGRELVADIKGNPRALKPEETALLSHETVTRENNFDNAVDAVNSAKEPGDLAEAKQRLAAARDDVQELYDAGQKVGTESGQSLQARKILVNQDYSLARMEATRRAVANDGKPLSESQLAEVKAAHEKIKELQAKLDEHEAKQSTEKQGEIYRQIVKESLTAAKEGAKTGKTLQSVLDDAAAKAKQRIIARRGRLMVTVDPLNVAGLVDEAIIGASHIARGLTKFGEWSTQMVKDFGDRISPYLKDLWDRAQQYHDAHAKLFEKSGGKDAKTPADVLGKISENAKAGKELSQKAVFDLARAHVNAGVEGLDNVMAKVTDDIQAAHPGITEREVRDTFSNYGEVRLPSKAADLTALRDYRRQAQLVSALEDAQAGEAPKKSGMQRDKPSDRVRELQRQVIEEMKAHGIETTDPEKQLASNLQRYKTSLKNRTADLQKKIAANDYTKPTRATTQLDAEATKLKSDYQRAKDVFDTQLEKDRLANRPIHEKVMDTFTKWRRSFVLSSPITLAKLTSAAAERMVFTPLEEAVGAGISKVLPKLAEKAPREGGASVKAEAKAMTEGFMQGAKDSWDVLRTGRSDLDVVYGKRQLIPKTAVEFIGNIHGALKTIPKRNEFARSFQKRIESALASGVDVSDPLVQTRIATLAYKDANRSIFMQDNRVVDFYKRGISALEQPSKTTGKVPVGAKLGATTLRTLLPIVKVPTNIVAETFQYSLGTVTGGARLANALRKGVDTLHPDQADLIMRELKKGSVGAAVMALGYLNADKIGGYYQPGQKRDAKDVKFGAVKVFGANIPTYLVHNPLLEQLQIGATIRRVADSKLRQKDSDKQGITAGAMAGALGVVEEVPFIREMAEVSKAFDPHSRGAFAGELAKSIAVPQGIQWLATKTDQRNGETVKRKPESVLQHIETGIPGLRKQVPEKGSDRF